MIKYFVILALLFKNIYEKAAGRFLFIKTTPVLKPVWPIKKPAAQLP
jgi:hypothetical protein